MQVARTVHREDRCMLEYPVARAFVDNRVNRIDGGTTEVQRDLIARKL